MDHITFAPNTFYCRFLGRTSELVSGQSTWVDPTLGRRVRHHNTLVFVLSFSQGATFYG